jgi:putative ABC transport system permease protein
MSVLQDISFAVRQFRRSPGFTITVVLTLALGVGATTAIFSLVYGILLRPLPFPHPEQLVAIATLEFPPGVAATNTAGADRVGSSYPNFFDWRQRNHTFESLASYDETVRLFSKMNGDGSRVIPGARVSANLFSTLGVAPALGRTFTEEEEQPGHRVVILSHELWASDFASSSNVIGETVKISDEPSIVVGVMPAGFHYPIGDPVHFWTTFSQATEGKTPLTSLRGDARLSVIGRIKKSADAKQALADLNAIQRGLVQQYYENTYWLGVSIAPLLEQSVANVRSALSLLLAAVGTVLVIGCANVGGLLLARANGRQSEIGIRTALGASRIRVLRQLLVEALLLAFAGGFLGIPMSLALLRIGLRYIPTDVPRLYAVSLDARVLTFAIGLSVATALIFGLIPAWKMSRSDPASTLRDGGLTTTSSRRRNHLHHALVLAETALGFTLLIGSGLLIRSMIKVLVIDPGFDTHTVAFDVALTKLRYPGSSTVQFYDKLLSQLAALPGVTKVSAADPLPLQGPYWTNCTIAGFPTEGYDIPTVTDAVVEPGYFETLSIPLIRGRTLDQHDNDAKSAPVAVINQSFARKYFPGVDPIGHYFTPQPDRNPKEPWIARQIVGIVGDTRNGDLSHPYLPEYFLPYAQDPGHQRPEVVMKVSGDPRNYKNMIRKTVAEIDKDLPIFAYRTFTADINAQAAQPRFEAALVSGFAVIALLLSALGLYAVLSYIVAERKRELGLRMALGASRSHVLMLVLRRGLVLACVGTTLGALASVFAATLIQDVLYEVKPLDGSVFLTVAAVLLFVSTVAALIPAFRAARVDPMQTLRDQ